LAISFSVLVLSAAPALAQRGGEDPAVAYAREMLIKYYPNMTIGDIFPSRYNEITKKDGRYAAAVTTELSGYLKVVDIKGKDIVEVFERQYPPEALRRLNVTFTLDRGQHLIVASPETAAGKEYVNLEIFPLTSRRPAPLFSLKLVENLSLDFVDDGLILLIQRWPNIINNDPQIRPVKSVYFMLAYDSIANTYNLQPHITRLPGAATDVSARLNNQAVSQYERGDLKSARETLDRVVSMGGPGISISRRNLILVTREIESLEMQKVVSKGAFVTPNYDDARYSFFTGNFRDCILQIRARGRTTTADNMVMLAASYALTESWGDLAGIDNALRGAPPEFKSEYVSYICDLLDSMNARGEYFAYLKKLEELDKYHPNLIAHKARLLVRDGRGRDAAGMLDGYLAKFKIAPHYRAKLLLIRWEIAFLQGETGRMKELEDELWEMPKPDLSYLVEMLNFSPERIEERESSYPIEKYGEPDLKKRFGEVVGG
jgi:hypothetical protein